MSDQETMIVINDGDLEEGYFRFGTSKRKVAEKVLRKVGPQGIVEEKISTNSGRPVFWDFKIKPEFFNFNSFGLGRKRVASPKTLEALRAAREKKVRQEE